MLKILVLCKTLCARDIFLMRDNTVSNWEQLLLSKINLIRIFLRENITLQLKLCWFVKVLLKLKDEKGSNSKDWVNH